MPGVEPVQELAIREKYLNTLIACCEVLNVGNPSFTNPLAESRDTTVTSLQDVWIAPPVRIVDMADTSGWGEFSGLNVTFETAIVRSETANLVLLGRPGIGKTTSARYVAIQLARDALQRKKHLIPLYIPLRAISRNELALKSILTAALSAFERFVGSEEEAAAIKNYLVSSDEPWAVIFDGIDELGSDRSLRSRVMSDLSELLLTLETSGRVKRAIWTCRTTDYEDQTVQVRSADHFVLSGFGEPELRAAVQKWHTAFNKVRRKAGEPSIDPEAQGRQFLNSVFADPELMAIARVPLFLNLMQLISATEKTLPSSVTEIAQSAIKLQFMVRARQRLSQSKSKGSDSIFADLQAESRSWQILESLASGCLERIAVGGVRSWSWEELRNAIESVLGTRTPEGFLANERWVRPYIQHFMEGHGIIEPTGADGYTFTNNLFCDVAAARVLDRCDASIRLSRAKSVAWSGAFRHWSTFAWQDGDARGLQFVRSCLERGEDATSILAIAGYFVASLDRRKVSPDWFHANVLQKVREMARSRIMQRLEDISLRIDDRLALGDALSDIGDPRIPRSISSWSNLASEICWMSPANCIIGLAQPVEVGEKYRGCLPSPQFALHLKRFGILQFPVTNAQFMEFIESGGYSDLQHWKSEEAKAWTRKDATFVKSLRSECLKQAQIHYQTEINAGRLKSDELEGFVDRLLVRDKPLWWLEPRFNHPGQPVVGINWWEASAFCDWLEQKISREIGRDDLIIRLPTEFEWERAARYPAIVDEKAVATPGPDLPPGLVRSLRAGIARTATVGLFPWARQVGGPFDMIGNVWDWTCSLNEPYPHNGSAHDCPEGSMKSRIVRGSSWLSGEKNSANACFRSYDPPYNAYDDVGFRPVIILDELSE